MNRPDPTPFVNAARQLLNANDPEGAERVLAPLIERLRTDAPALHLMGSIKKARGQAGEAERFFRAAIAHALSEGSYYNDLGVLLQARGAYEEAIRIFRAALALMPHEHLVRVNLTRCLMHAEAYEDAAEEARRLIATMPGPEGWSLLAQVQRAQERHEEALVSTAAALERAPNVRGLRHNYAAALDRAGRPGEALEQYEQLARRGVDTPELALSFARALYGAERKSDGEGVLESALLSWPASPTLHAALARMRALRGEGEAAAILMEAQLERTPEDIALRLACADALHRGGFNERAAEQLEAGLDLAPESPPLWTAYGFVLDELDRPEEALSALRRAAAFAGETHASRRNLLSTLMRAGQVEQALRLARDLRREEPHEQYLIAAEATALRVLNDKNHASLCDYSRLLRSYEIEPPRGFFTIEAFNAALGEVLRRQHVVNAHPLDQTMRHVSQTGRNLLSLEEPRFKAFFAAVDGAVRDYISRLRPELGDPASARRTDRFRFAGLWSTRIVHGGALANHVRDRGWISSAYFVAASPAERPREKHAGWLKFGEPNRPIAGCGPEVMIEPKPGRLVLFPSYFWHGAVAFEGAERLSLSFDVIPA